MAEFHYISDLVWDSYASLVGGSITNTGPTSLTYLSEAGFRIVLQGTGFVFDAGNLPTAGTITQIEVFKGRVPYANFTGLATGLQDYVTLALGQTSGVAGTTATDIDLLYSHMRLGDDLYDGSELGRLALGFDGNDTMYGNGGDDSLSGGKGVDAFYGGDGADFVMFDLEQGARQGVSVDLTRTVGNILNDGFGNVETATEIEGVVGGDRADRMVGNALANDFYGLGGRDDLYGGKGNDSLDGGAGDDYMDAGQGIDTLEFFSVTAADQGVIVDLSRERLQVRNDGFGNTEVIKGIEFLSGSVNDDSLTGNGQDNALWGRDGSDTLTGGKGNDGLYGNAGNDAIYGGFGNDVMAGDKGTHAFYGGSGTDKIGFWDIDAKGHGVSVDLGRATNQIADDGYGQAETAKGIENLEGSTYADILTGNAAGNGLWGGDGFDTLTGGDGDDFLSGNSGRDRILGGAGWDTIIGGESDDVLTGDADSDYFLFFGAAPGDWGVDRITDFEAGIDGIVINAQWASDLSNGTLLAGQFIAGSGLTSATTAAQRLIYNSSTGDLYFDADGTGAAQARLIAVLNNLTADRIYTDNPF